MNPKPILTPLYYLLTSRKVMVAALAMIVTLAKVAFPTIPDEVVKTFDAFALAIITAITIEDYAEKRNESPSE